MEVVRSLQVSIVDGLLVEFSRVSVLIFDREKIELAECKKNERLPFSISGGSDRGDGDGDLCGIAGIFFGLTFGFKSILGTYFFRSGFGGGLVGNGLNFGFGLSFSSSRRRLSYSKIFSRNLGDVSSSDCNDRDFERCIIELIDGRRPPC